MAFAMCKKRWTLILDFSQVFALFVTFIVTSTQVSRTAPPLRLILVNELLGSCGLWSHHLKSVSSWSQHKSLMLF